jgi:hypothetical protein
MELSTPRCLEALAYREALAQALDLHVGEVMVVTDCMEAGLQARIWASLAIF